MLAGKLECGNSLPMSNRARDAVSGPIGTEGSVINEVVQLEALAESLEVRYRNLRDAVDMLRRPVPERDARDEKMATPTRTRCELAQRLTEVARRLAEVDHGFASLSEEISLV
jgi:hypothetical protein